ncbi:hypothetical protein TSOC_015462, partial [Tetrabaena socialis]
PWTVGLQLLSLGYIAATADAAGLWTWLALQTAARTSRRPLLLPPALFALSAALAAATSADTALLALSPAVIYAAAATDADPAPLVAVHLAAACVGGMLVPMAGAPNIVAAQAFRLSFGSFFGWMLLPTLGAGGGIGGAAAAVVVMGLLHLLLRRRRHPRLDGGPGIPYPDPGILLHDQ